MLGIVAERALNLGDLNTLLIKLSLALTDYINMTPVPSRNKELVSTAARNCADPIRSWLYNNRSSGITGEPEVIRETLQRFRDIDRIISDTPELLDDGTIRAAHSVLSDPEGIKKALQFSLLISDVKQNYSWSNTEIERMAGDLSDGTIGRAIKCQRMPEESNLQKISAVFGVPIDGIVGDPGAGDYPYAAEVRQRRAQLYEILDQLNHIQLSKLEVRAEELLHTQRNPGENTR